MELHDHSHLRDARWDKDLFVILSWFLSGVSFEPSNQAHIFRHLYVITLLIPGDISLTFGFDLDYEDHIFDDGWFHVTRFPTYHISDVILGHISFQMRFTDLHGIARSSPLMDTHQEMTCLLFYHGPLVEPFLSHSVKPAFFGIWMSSYFPFWGTPFWFVSLILLWMWMTRTAHSMMDDLRSYDFLT